MATSDWHAACGRRRMHGTIDRINSSGGFGFITDQDGREYFFHLSGLMGVAYEDLAPGVEVEFMARPPSSGDEYGEHPRAVSIRLADAALEAPDHERLSPRKTA